MSTAKVFVGSLPPGCKPEELRHLFTNYGNVVECDIMNRCGFVHLETYEMAEAAIAALNGSEFKGQAIVVEPGRPKDKRSGGVGGAGAAGTRRPPPGHGTSNFNRAGNIGNNSFRAAAGGERKQGSNSSHFGPVRSEGNFRQHRNAPYNKAQTQHSQNFDAPTHSFKNKFNQGGSQLNHNDYHAGGHMGGNGLAGPRAGAGPSNNFAQDRRGFALPDVDHHQQQQMTFSTKQSRFGSGAMLPNGSNADSGHFARNRNSQSMHSGSSRGGRMSFSPNRGGFGGRGGFSARRADGNGPNSNMPQSHAGNFNNHGATNGYNHNAPNSYQTDFPPLGSHGGGATGNRNRFNGPRPASNVGGNRRF